MDFFAPIPGSLELGRISLEDGENAKFSYENNFGYREFIQYSRVGCNVRSYSEVIRPDFNGTIITEWEADEFTNDRQPCWRLIDRYDTAPQPLYPVPD